MKIGSFARTVAALALVLSLSAVALGDVIRMKDGQVIRGQIISTPSSSNAASEG